MRFAFVTDELPRPGSAGHLAMNHAIIIWLRQRGYEVTIFLVRPRLRWPVERYGEAVVMGPGIRMWRGYIFVSNLKGVTAIMARLAASLLPQAPATFLRRRGRAREYGVVDSVLGAFITPAQSSWCGKRIVAWAPDGVLADTIFRAPALWEPGLDRLNRVIIAHDVFYLRHQALRTAGYKIYPPELPRDLEAGLLNAANAIVAIQPHDAELIRAMCPERVVCTAPMPAIACRRPGTIARIPGRLVFAGSASLPNIDGLRWFFAEVWPLLKASHGAVTLDLVGESAAAITRLPIGVTRLGRVKNLSAILHRSALAISPLRVGSGLKIKMLDYARHGLVTVATPESLQGFATDAATPFIAARDAAGFANAIAAKLATPGTADEQSALDYVTTHYNVDVSFSGLAAALKIPVKESHPNHGRS